MVIDVYIYKLSIISTLIK